MNEPCGCRIECIERTPEEDTGEETIIYCPLHANAGRMREALKALRPMFDNDSNLLAVYKQEILDCEAALAATEDK